MRIFLMGATPSFNVAESTSPEDRLRRTGGNVGNQVIAYGLLKTIVFESVSWDYSVGPEFVKNNFDIIVIAAANFLHSGFDFGGMSDFIEQTGLPVVMVGLGAQSKDYNPNISLMPGTLRLIKIVSERSNLIGVRGNFTAEVLLGLGVKNVQVTGCPSYYMAGKRGLGTPRIQVSDNLRVAFNSSRDVIRHSFDASIMKESVLDIMSECLVRNSDFIIQSELDEIALAENMIEERNADHVVGIGSDFLNFYGERFDKVSLLHWARLHLKVHWDAQRWISEMNNYDLVVGHRFHGAMAALQAGVPACVICHDSRTTEMCDFLGIPHIDLVKFGSFKINKVIETINNSNLEARYNSLLPLYKRFLEENRLMPAV